MTVRNGIFKGTKLYDELKREIEDDKKAGKQSAPEQSTDKPTDRKVPPLAKP